MLLLISLPLVLHILSLYQSIYISNYISIYSYLSTYLSNPIFLYMYLSLSIYISIYPYLSIPLYRSISLLLNKLQALIMFSIQISYLKSRCVIYSYRKLVKKNYLSVYMVKSIYLSIANLLYKAIYLSIYTELLS